MNFELISQYYLKKIIIYYISSNFLLQSIIIDKNYTTDIKIYKTQIGTYQPIFNEEFMSNSNFVLEILNQVKLLFKKKEEIILKH